MLRRGFLLWLVACSLSFSQEKFSGNNAFSYISELCHPRYKGRKTGSPEARRAALWIADHFKSWGVEPLGTNGSYIQEFPMLVTQQKKAAKMKLLHGAFGSIEYVEGVDFNPYMNSGSASLKAEVVFVGYGIAAANQGWDDYAGMDVKGKIVLIYRGTPQDGRDWGFCNERFYKVRTAAEKGAAGLLMLDRGDWPIRGATITGEGYQPYMPMFNISKKAARDLFAGSHKNLDLVIRDLAKKPQSFNLGRIMAMNVQVERMEPQVGENILGIVRGIDPILADEYIVIGAHMDHNGVSSDGHLYAGADDNTSGAAIVMELARIFSRQKQKRSIIFAEFGGEEQGLLGSWYFNHQPTVAAEKIAAMFNLDMEGAGDGGASISGRNYYLEPLRSWVNAYSDSVRKKLELRRGSGMFGSDHSFFVEQGIPAFYFSSTGDHPFYHQFEDDPSTINVASLQFVGDRGVDLLSALANAPGSLLFNGNRSGRFFFLFGDQIDFAFQPLSTLHQSDSLLQRAIPSAVRCIVYSLALSGEKQQDLFLDYDRLEQEIKKQSSLIRFKNSDNLDEAAAQARLSAAIAIDGSSSLHTNPGHARMLCRSGVNWLSIRDSQDPVFQGNGMSSWGRSLLQIWSEEKGILDCTVSDTAKISSLLNAGAMKMFLRLRQPQALALAEFLAGKLDKKHCLLILETTPDQPCDEVWRLFDRCKSGTIHLAVARSMTINDNYKYQWMQKLYDFRKNTTGVSNTYASMMQIMGDNLKNFIGK